MKRPTFTPKDIGITNPDSTGAVILHLKDANNNDQMVPLNPNLRAALGQRLISGPLLEVDTHTPALYLSPANIRTYQRQDGDLALELQIGGGRAVHVLLPGLLPDALLNQLKEFLPGSSNNTLN